VAAKSPLKWNLALTRPSVERAWINLKNLGGPSGVNVNFVLALDFQIKNPFWL
jgi:hypothetical protein